MGEISLREIVDVINFIDGKVRLFFADTESEDPSLLDYDELLGELQEAILAEFKATPGQAVRNFGPTVTLSSERVLSAVRKLTKEMSSPVPTPAGLY